MMVLFLTSCHATYRSEGSGWCETQVLSKTELRQHHWNTTQSQHDKIRDEKGRWIKTSKTHSVFYGRLRKCNGSSCGGD